MKKSICIATISVLIILTSCSKKSESVFICTNEVAYLLSQTKVANYNITVNVHDDYDVKYPTIDNVNNIEAYGLVNRTIVDILDTYCASFMQGTNFALDYEIVRMDSSLLCILFSGQVLTPAKGIAQAFALNFNLENGHLLSLNDFAEESDIIDALEKGIFETADTRSETEEAPEYAYRNYRVMFEDTEHKFDFFFDSDNLYIIASRSAPYGYYSIHKTALDK